MVLNLDDGICYQVHTAKPSRYECFGTFVNIFKGAICFVMCGYILRKMFKNHRRALAGYTKNTISIDVHMSMMFMVGLWSAAWGATKIFDVSNADSADDVKTHEVRLLAISLSMCYGLSSLCEVLIMLLLCSRSIGKNDFTRSLVLGSSWSFLTFVGLMLTVFAFPKSETNYMLSRQLFVGVIIRNSITFLMGAVCILFFHITKSDRLSILTFSTYICPMFFVMSVSQSLVLTESYIAVNLGICMGDLCETLHFIIFPAICYFSLKRDCQYWSIGVDEDEETSMLGYANELTWSEMPNYQELVIPKTELFYRSTIVETVDMSVEIHLWRRKLACVKRFKFDLLTRDNIKYFKVEANIFKKLSHENIVRFYGILIDPPSLGIVMHFCTNSDVFQNLEKLRLELREARAEEEKSAISVCNPLSKEREVSKDKNSHPLGRFAGKENFLTIFDDHMVHSALSQEEELQPLPGGKREGTERRSEDWDADYEEGRMDISRRGGTMAPPSNHRFTMKMSVPTRLSALTGRHLEAKETFEPMLIALQVCRGMAYLHMQGITHRDMKSLNVLLDDKFNAQIADFGESSFGEISSGQNMAEMGTPGWAAPELLLGSGVSKASDVFSFGVILWELLTFRAPSVLIDIKTLKMPEVCNLPSTYEHPLLKVASKRNHSVDVLTDKFTLSSTGSTGFGVFFDRKVTQNTSTSPESSGIEVEDRDLTMVEIGDLHTARVLMCDLKLRPPMPCGIPAALKNILVTCWSACESDRPTFAEIYTDLEKMLVTQEFDKIDIPCAVEAVINTCAASRQGVVKRESESDVLSVSAGGTESLL